MDAPLAEDREFAMLDAGQVTTLKAVERMGASLSLFGIALIFVTFAIFKRLRTIPNTFIFFASVANVGACVACLIAYDGIQAMSMDRGAALCQAQAFLFEWYVFLRSVPGFGVLYHRVVSVRGCHWAGRGWTDVSLLLQVYAVGPLVVVRHGC